MGGPAVRRAGLLIRWYTRCTASYSFCMPYFCLAIIIPNLILSLSFNYAIMVSLPECFPVLYSSSHIRYRLTNTHFQYNTRSSNFTSLLGDGPFTVHLLRCGVRHVWESFLLDVARLFNTCAKSLLLNTCILSISTADLFT